MNQQASEEPEENDTTSEREHILDFPRAAQADDPSDAPDIVVDVDQTPIGSDNETLSVTCDAPVRLGSPFAIDPLEASAPRPIEPFYDVGPIRYTAMGAVAASVMVLGFGSIAAWWFPSGGALIAALGCALSVFGMYSTFRFVSVGLLAIHLGLFVLSYGRSLG